MTRRNDSRQRRLLRARRSGYTIVEMAIVMTILGILLMMATPKLPAIQQKRVARNARDVFVWTAARARARAIQQGRIVELEINPTTARSWIVKKNSATALASDTLFTIDFKNEYDKVTVSSSAITTKTTLCYTPRGYALIGAACSSSSPTGNVEISFRRGAYSANARITPAGRIDRI